MTEIYCSWCGEECKAGQRHDLCAAALLEATAPHHDATMLTLVTPRGEYAHHQHRSA